MNIKETSEMNTFDDLQYFGTQADESHTFTNLKFFILLVLKAYYTTRNAL
jgi:hypothetical protein